MKKYFIIVLLFLVLVSNFLASGERDEDIDIHPTCKNVKCVIIDFDITSNGTYVVGDRFTYHFKLKNVGTGDINTTATVISDPPELLDPYRDGRGITVQLSEGEEEIYPGGPDQIYTFSKLGSNTIGIKFDEQITFFYPNMNAMGSGDYITYFVVTSRWEREWSENAERLNNEVKNLTGDIKTLTIIIMGLTAFNAIIIAYDLVVRRPGSKKSN